MTKAPVDPWAIPSSEVLALLNVTPSVGLSEDEVIERRACWGPNQLRKARTLSRFEIFTNQLKSVVVVLLVAASLLSFAVGDLLEGSAIAVAIGLTVLIGFVTELRAIRSMEALRRLAAVHARVRRGGVDKMLGAEDLVPGDIVLLEGGDRVTADVRLIKASKLQADESALTGESVPVSKSAASICAEAPLADRKNMLYKGTTITRGSGSAVVVGTGMQSELGRIARLVDAAEYEPTPLEKRLAVLAQRLVWICLGIAALTIVIGIANGRDTMLMIETGIALAVAAIPEGLPVVATIALARGMWRLAARHALIKNLSAVETLGATSIIVADKTGTLTENRLSVVAMNIGSKSYAFGRAIEHDSEEVDASKDPRLAVALEISTLCGNASLSGDEATGDPLEIALLRAARLGGLEHEALADAFPELREEAFDADIKMMATVHKISRGYRVAVKGAPESILEASSSEWREVGAQPMTAEAKRAVMEQSERMAKQGLRILALAQKITDREDTEVYEGLSFVGLVGLADPPRADVVEPIAACHRAGIRVIMATGDQAATAASIAKAVGLVTEEEPAVIHGSELSGFAELSPERRDELLSAQIFARVTPEQKLDIIDLHQRDGAIVAMTGDGVNDAPALRKAEIGVAMGLRGTDVARDAADMVLKDDSFESIVAAIEQGRAIFENIRRFVVYLLSCNVSEVFVVTSAVAVSAPLPLLPLQILFLNLVTDVFPALALGFGRGEPEAMSRPPRQASDAIVTRKHWAIIGGHAAVMTVAVLGAMALSGIMGATSQEATTVSFLTLALAQLWHVFNMRGRGTGIFENDVVSSPWVWGAVVLCLLLVAAATFVRPLATVLHVVPLDSRQWLTIIGMSFLPLLVGQIAIGHKRGEAKKLLAPENKVLSHP